MFLSALSHPGRLEEWSIQIVSSGTWRRRLEVWSQVGMAAKASSASAASKFIGQEEKH